jgi:hypothetical protein
MAASLPELGATVDARGPIDEVVAEARRQMERRRGTSANSRAPSAPAGSGADA